MTAVPAAAVGAEEVGQSLLAGRDTVSTPAAEGPAEVQRHLLAEHTAVAAEQRDMPLVVLRVPWNHQMELVQKLLVWKRFYLMVWLDFFPALLA